MRLTRTLRVCVYACVVCVCVCARVWQVGPPTLIALAELLVHNAANAVAGKDSNPWLMHLVQTRYTVLLPISNSLG